MRYHIYNFLVNRHIGIKQRYHRVHDKSHGVEKIMSWVYLLWLNFAYYFLFFRFLGKIVEEEIYEKKKLIVGQSESECHKKQFKEDVDSYVRKLSDYDYISFDIFDTLIFRPFSEPTDLFYIVGEKLGFMDFKMIRQEAEGKARKKCFRDNGHYEVNIDDIWRVLSKETGIDKELGMQVELEIEKKLCYANPFMKQVFQRLVDMGKYIMIISDMYIPADWMKKILINCGYNSEKALYVSCEYGISKANGQLYDYIKKELGLEK